MAHLLRHLFDGGHAGAVQIIIVDPGLNEQVVLDVLLHLLPGGDKMVVPPVFLMWSLLSRRVCLQNTQDTSKFVEYIELTEHAEQIEHVKLIEHIEFTEPIELTEHVEQIEYAELIEHI